MILLHFPQLVFNHDCCYVLQKGVESFSPEVLILYPGQKGNLASKL